jgi:flagellar hook-associated protein 2
MSTNPVSVNSAGASPLSITGLASGLNTTAIISALMGAERAPVTRLTHTQEKLQGDQSALRAIQNSLQQLSSSVSEFALPSLYESAQSVTSSEPTRIAAVATLGAVIGGHEVEVTQLATSSQRAFTFTSPAAEEKITIDGHEYAVKPAETARELAASINSDSTSTVYASAQENGTIVLSSRKTGNTGAEFVKVTDPGTALVEVAGGAHEGKNAEYKVDGVAGTSASNTVTEAIAGVTLTLTGLTSGGPVTIDVKPPGPSTSGIEAQVQAFVKLYNTTTASIQKQLATKPPTREASAERGTGTLFGDQELGGLLTTMRQAMYEPIAGLAAEMSSLASIGVSTGAATAGGSSTSSLAGQLSLNTTQLTEAVRGNPVGVQHVLAAWSQSLQGLLNSTAEPGGSIEARINGDASQITNYATQITNMNEVLLVREKALINTYAKLEGIISQNNNQTNWLASQSEQLIKSGL